MEPELNEEVERLQQLIKRAVSALAEHASTVQIFATLHNPATDETVSLTGGYGNHFAIRGQVGQWIDDLDMPSGDEDPQNHLN